MYGVASLLDEIFAVLHELLQGHHGVIVNVKFVIGGPCFHSDEHDAGIKLFLENLGKSKEII